MGNPSIHSAASELVIDWIAIWKISISYKQGAPCTEGYVLSTNIPISRHLTSDICPLQEAWPGSSSQWASSPGLIGNRSVFMTTLTPAFKCWVTYFPFFDRLKLRPVNYTLADYVYQWALDWWSSHLPRLYPLLHFAFCLIWTQIVCIPTA